MTEPRPADPLPVWVWLPLAGMLLTLPVSWPAWRALTALRHRRWERAGTAPEVDSSEVRALAAAGRVRRATVWVQVIHSMASGAEEDERLELTLVGGERRRLREGANSQGEALQALADAGVRVAWREAHVSGIGVALGWVAWFWATGVLGVVVALALGAPGR